MTTIEQLAEWGCHLVRNPDDPARDPIGRPTGAWDISGTEYYLEDYITWPPCRHGPADIGDMCQNIYNRDHVVAAINGMDAEDFTLVADALETRLTWRGYHYREAGWACNVKLHDVWKYLRYWDDILDGTKEIYVDESEVVEREWEDFLDNLSDELDANRFLRLGRSGGWLVYERSEMDLVEAEALYQLYEQIPDMLDALCREIATYTAGMQLATHRNTELDDWVIGEFYLTDGTHYTVEYP